MSQASTLLTYQPPKQPNANIIKLISQHQDLFFVQSLPPFTAGALYPLKLDAKEILIEVQPDSKFTHPKYFHKDNKLQKIVKQPTAAAIFVESGLCEPNKKAWFYIDESQKPQGPISSVEMDLLIEKGSINMQTKVALETLEKLVRVEKIMQAVNKRKEAEQKQKEIAKQKEQEEAQQKQQQQQQQQQNVQTETKQPEKNVETKKEEIIDFSIDYQNIKNNIDIGQWSKPLVGQQIQVKVTKAFVQQKQQQNKQPERKRSDNKSMHVEGNKGNLYQKRGYDNPQQVILEVKPKEESDSTLNNEVQDYLKKLETRKVEVPTEKNEKKQQQQEKKVQVQAQATQQKQEQAPQQQQQQKPKQENNDEEWEIVGQKKPQQKKQQPAKQQEQKKEEPQQNTAASPKKVEKQQEEQVQIVQPQQQQVEQEEEDDGWETVGANQKEKKKVNKKVQSLNQNVPGFTADSKQNTITVSQGSAKKVQPQKQKQQEQQKQQSQQQQQPKQPEQEKNEQEEDEGWIEVGQPQGKQTQTKKGK